MKTIMGWALNQCEKFKQKSGEPFMILTLKHKMCKKRRKRDVCCMNKKREREVCTGPAYFLLFVLKCR